MKYLARTMSIGALAMLSCGAAAVLPATPALAIPVFDATNYTQNLLQAARALDQINNQVKSLQNEATMLESMARNLKQLDFPQLTRIKSALDRIDQLMDQAKGIDFKVTDLDRQFDKLFPAGTAASTDQRVLDARGRLDNAMESFRHSMKVQAGVVANIREDAGLLSDLLERSSSAEGSLQAQQATNQLIALSAKQQLQLEELLAAEFRSQSIERARRGQAEAEAREATRRFLGTGKAYSPPGN